MQFKMNVKVDIVELINECDLEAKCFRIEINNEMDVYNDKGISRIFCIDIDEYKKRLRNVCKTYEDVFGLWINEKSIDEDVLVKKFKEEFFAELMLLKMSNSINDLSYAKF